MPAVSTKNKAHDTGGGQHDHEATWKGVEEAMFTIGTDCTIGKPLSLRGRRLALRGKPLALRGRRLALRGKPLALRGKSCIGIGVEIKSDLVLGQYRHRHSNQDEQRHL